MSNKWSVVRVQESLDSVSGMSGMSGQTIVVKLPILHRPALPRRSITSRRYFLLVIWPCGGVFIMMNAKGVKETSQYYHQISAKIFEVFIMTNDSIGRTGIWFLGRNHEPIV